MRRLSALILIGLPLLQAAALAAQLDPGQCDSLKAERESLATAGGLAADLERGPEWGQANLSPERLRQIRDFLELEEKIAFRCPRPKPPPAPATATPAPGQQPGAAQPGKKSTQKQGPTGAIPGVKPTEAKTPERKAVKIEVKKPAQKTVQKAPAPDGDDGKEAAPKQAPPVKKKTQATTAPKP